jgi:hypothetical protein
MTNIARAATAAVVLSTLAACGPDIEGELASCKVEAAKIFYEHRADRASLEDRDAFTVTCMRARGYNLAGPPRCEYRAFLRADCYEPVGTWARWGLRAQKWTADKLSWRESRADVPPPPPGFAHVESERHVSLTNDPLGIRKSEERRCGRYNKETGKIEWFPPPPPGFVVQGESQCFPGEKITKRLYYNPETGKIEERKSAPAGERRQ